MAASLYDANMSMIEDGALLSIRRSRAYRAAIWLVRAANLVGLPLVIWSIVSMVKLAPTLPSPVFMVAWTVGFVTLVSAAVLLYRSGLPFERRGLTWVLEQRIGNAILRDVYMRRPQ